MAVDYTSTLNLPKTEFSMRANLPQREPEMLKSEFELGVYEKLLEKNNGKEPFILHDGPPFQTDTSIWVTRSIRFSRTLSLSIRQ